MHQITFLVACFGVVSSAKFITTKISPQSMWNSTYTDQLRQDLLLNYDKFARPTHHHNITTVYFDITIRHVEFNEFKSFLAINSYVQLFWTDEKLKWNPEDYGGITRIQLADHEFWQPDIFLANSATYTTGITRYANTHCIVSKNGQVISVPPVQLNVLCNVNLKYWPFDVQHCNLEFLSWTYSGAYIDLQLYKNHTNASLQLVSANNQWKLIKTVLSRQKKYYDPDPDPYIDITVYIMLQRSSGFYAVTVLSPLIVLFIFITFWLPPEATERVLINVFTTLTIFLFLGYFSVKLPATDTTPLIVLFYSCCLCVVTVSMIVSVFVISLAKIPHLKPLPRIIKKALSSPVGKFLGKYQMDNNVHQNENGEMRLQADFEIDIDEHQITKSSDNGIKSQKDWILLAVAIDKLLSICFCCIIVVFFITILI